MPFLSLPFVVDLVAKASLILGVTALIAASLRHASASARHFVWTLGLLCTLAAPIIAVAMPRWELPIVRVASSAMVPASSTPIAASSSVAVHTGDRVKPAPSLGRARSESSSDAIAPAPSSGGSRPAWPFIAFVAWAVGAIAIAARMLLGLIAVQWMSRRMPAVTDAAWLPQARALATDFGLAHVRFLRGATGTMPMAWGIVRPAVVVPADADTWPAHRVRVVLLHELAHVKRRDCLTHVVAQIACAAYWFNPLAWMAARRLRAERERACDDLVLAAGTRGSDYADQLLDIARVMTAGRFPAVLAGASLAMAKRSQLEGRLLAILDPSVSRSGLSRARAAASAMLFAFVMIVVASVQPWAEEAPMAPSPAAIKDLAPETHPGEAPVAAPRGAAEQEAVQDVVQGQVQGDIQGRVQGAVQGGVTRGVKAGVAAGVPGGIVGGVISGVTGGVVSGVAGAVVDGIADGLSEALAGAQTGEVGVEKAKEVQREGRARDPRTVNALLEALKDSDKEVRETAMNVLVQMRDPRMFDPLVAALKDASADVREHAAFGLGQLRDARAIEPLAAAIKDQSASVREQIVFALGQLRAVAAIEPLTVALHDSAPDVREQAAFALGQLRDRRTVEPLISALKDEKADVREQAAFALGQIRDAKAIDALIIALKDADADVREQAAFALGQIGDPKAIDGLTTALKDASASVRQQAAFALGQIR